MSWSFRIAVWALPPTVQVATMVAHFFWQNFNVDFRIITALLSSKLIRGTWIVHFPECVRFRVRSRCEHPIPSHRHQCRGLL